MKILDLMKFILNRIEKIENFLTEKDVVQDFLKHHALISLVTQVGEAFKYFREKPDASQEDFLLISAIYMAGSGFSVLRDQLIHGYWENICQVHSSKNMFSNILISKLPHEMIAIKKAFEHILNKGGLENIEMEAYEAQRYQGEVKYFYKLGDYLDFLHLSINEFMDFFIDKTSSEDDIAYLGLCGYVQCIGQLISDYNGLWALMAQGEAELSLPEEANRAFELFRRHRNKLSHLNEEFISQKKIYILSLETLRDLYESASQMLLFIKTKFFSLERTERVHQNIFGELKHELFKDLYDFIRKTTLDETVLGRITSISETLIKLMGSKQLILSETDKKNIQASLQPLNELIDSYSEYSQEQRQQYKDFFDQLDILNDFIEKVIRRLEAMEIVPVGQEKKELKREKSSESSSPEEKVSKFDEESLRSLLRERDQELKKLKEENKTLKEALGMQPEGSREKSSSSNFASAEKPEEKKDSPRSPSFFGGSAHH
jgi:hypothetical protein